MKKGVGKITPKEAETKYGKVMLKKMRATGFLSGITMSLNKNGEVDVPDRDYELAYRAARGKKIHPEEWD